MTSDSGALWKRLTRFSRIEVPQNRCGFPKIECQPKLSRHSPDLSAPVNATFHDLTLETGHQDAREIRKRMTDDCSPTSRLLNMGRPADENLPEVLPNHPTAAIYSQHPLPEVVPDSSPEAFAGHPPHYSQEKYPAFYDDAPKLPHDPSSPGAYGTHGMPYSPGQSPYNYPSTPGDPVSAFSPNSSVPWQRLDSVAGGDDQRTFVNSEPEQEKRICGIKRKIFLIVAGLLAVIIIAAAVGGGVGAAMSKKSNSDNSSDEPASETQSASPVESG